MSMQKSTLLLLALLVTLAVALGVAMAKCKQNSSSQQFLRQSSSSPSHLKKSQQRLLQNSDDFEKDRPCLDENGVVHYLNEEISLDDWNSGGARRRGLSTIGSGTPEECPMVDGEAVAPNAGNGTDELEVSATAPVPAPYAIVPSSMAPFISDSPISNPVSAPESSADEILPPSFYNMKQRKLVYCKVSVAMPSIKNHHEDSSSSRDFGDDPYQDHLPFNGDPFTRSNGEGGGNRDSQSDSSVSLDESRYEGSEDDSDHDEMRHVARRFLLNVRDVMANEIQFLSNHTFLVLEEEGFRRLGSTRALPPYRDPNSIIDYVEHDEIVLLASNLFSDVEYLAGVPAPKNIMWWEYTVAFWTVHDNVTYVEETVAQLTSKSIRDGNFYLHLKRSFKKLKAVSLPGDESNYLQNEWEESIVTPLDVQGWDTRRWAGLGLLIVTVLLILTLTATAKQRRKRVHEQEEWGAVLPTERDMNMFLTFGWDYDGEIFHAFNKNKLIYRDDDSMLIGGALLGDIVAPTSAETRRTDGSPSSRSQSSRSRSSRSRSSSKLKGSISLTGTVHEASERPHVSD